MLILNVLLFTFLLYNIQTYTHKQFTEMKYLFNY